MADDSSHDLRASDGISTSQAKRPKTARPLSSKGHGEVARICLIATSTLDRRQSFGHPALEVALTRALCPIAFAR